MGRLVWGNQGGTVGFIEACLEALAGSQRRRWEGKRMKVGGTDGW